MVSHNYTPLLSIEPLLSVEPHHQIQGYGSLYIILTEV